MDERPSRSVALGVAVGAALALLLFLSGVLTRAYVVQAFTGSEQVRTLRALADRALKDQLDEETGVRGFAATGEQLFLEPYRRGSADFPAAMRELLAHLEVLDLTRGAEAVREAQRINATWRRTVAAPLLSTPHHDANRRDTTRIEQHGKFLVDRFRAKFLMIIAHEIDGVERIVMEHARVAIDRIDAFLICVGTGTLLLGIFLTRHQRIALERLRRTRERLENERGHAVRLQAAYEAEKRIADRLQDAIAQRPLPTVRMLGLSATYVPATEETKVGGDWYDAFELPGNRVLFAIGDVAGHGLEAAVTMSRARQALASYALLEEDPARLLAHVNDDLVRQHAPMVTAIAGFADSHTFEFVFATAGHPPPILLEPNRKPRLLACGGLPLSIEAGTTYESRRIQSVPGAILVLYTDGAVEHSHNVIEGEAQLLEAIACIADVPQKEPARVIHDAVFTGRTVGDDVAILTIGFESTTGVGITLGADKGATTFAARVARRPYEDDVIAPVGPGIRPNPAS